MFFYLSELHVIFGGLHQLHMGCFARCQNKAIPNLYRTSENLERHLVLILYLYVCCVCIKTLPNTHETRDLPLEYSCTCTLELTCPVSHARATE